MGFRSSSSQTFCQIPGLSVNQNPCFPKHIVLGHLSKENNYAKLAYETVKLEVTLADNEYKGDDLDMFVANRDTVSDIITV